MQVFNRCFCITVLWHKKGMIDTAVLTVLNEDHYVWQIGKPANISPTKDRRKDMGSPLRNPGSPMRKNSRAERRYCSVCRSVHSLVSSCTHIYYCCQIVTPCQIICDFKLQMRSQGYFTNRTMYTTALSSLSLNLLLVKFGELFLIIVISQVKTLKLGKFTNFKARINNQSSIIW